MTTIKVSIPFLSGRFVTITYSDLDLADDVSIPFLSGRFVTYAADVRKELILRRSQSPFYRVGL